MEGSYNDRLDFGKMGYGCEHYRRRSKIRAPCCTEVFDCRHCYNESMVISLSTLDFPWYFRLSVQYVTQSSQLLMFVRTVVEGWENNFVKFASSMTMMLTKDNFIVMIVESAGT